MADSDDEDKGQPNMAGFLFGNLDENNNLDADYLDEVGASACSFQVGGTTPAVSLRDRGVWTVRVS